MDVLIDKAFKNSTKVCLKRYKKNLMSDWAYFKTIREIAGLTYIN